MIIDWQAFTPWSALAGGALIGLAASALWLLNGQIAGISGILGSLIRARPGRAWRTAFIIGLVVSPWLYGVLGMSVPGHIDAGPGLIVLAGLIVGIGTRYGSGCTSGHGVCGLSRLSPRSAIATLAFMAAGFATVAVIRHLVAPL
jgi:uncharacterized protein